MLPLVNTAPSTVAPQPSLVNTAIPDNNAQRVPFDNVAPPVSSPRAEADARANPQFLSPASQPAATAATIPALAGASGFAGQPFGTPATILAQFIGQSIPDQTGRQLESILQEYEKLIANSQVKYKPSNATKPQPEPSGVFGRLLEQAKITGSVPRPIDLAAAPVQSAPARPAGSALRTAQAKNNADNEFHLATLDHDEVNSDTNLSAQVVATRAIRSYQASLSRNEAEKIVT